MKSIVLSLVVLCLILSNSQIVAQNNSQPSLINVIPPSPTAAALGKYGEIPVSLYTGVPNISIPLYEINEGDIKLPISLSYHAGGIKVEEIASNVGLGWSLNAGGVITRTVRGKPDDDSGGYLNKSIAFDAYKFVNNLMTQGESITYTRAVGNGTTDSEPDLFNLNFAGISCQFFMKYDIGINETDYQSGHYSVKTMPHNNLRIEYVYQDKTWAITDTEGVKYHFQTKERTDTRTGTRDGRQNVISAWFITKIEDTRNNIILFEYEDYRHPSSKGNSNTNSYVIGISGNPDSSCSPCETIRNTSILFVNIFGKKLKAISAKTTKIDFSYTYNRSDIHYTVEPQLKEGELNRLKITDADNNLLKEYKFEYNYNRSRLFLDKLIEKSTNGSEKKPYSFVYNNMELPSNNPIDADFYMQDYWGFYNSNGNSYLKTLAPSEWYQQRYFEGADRSVEPLKAQAAILTELHYPTGGKSVFEYEINDYYNKTNLGFNLCENAATYYNSEISFFHQSRMSDNPDYTPWKTFTFSVDKDICGFVSATAATNSSDQRAAMTLISEESPYDNLIELSCPKIRIQDDACTDSKFERMSFKKDIIYTVKLYAVGPINNPSPSVATFSLKYIDPDKPYTTPYVLNNLAGGVRIKKIIDLSNTTETVKTKTYSYQTTNDENKVVSSGVLSHRAYYSHYTDSYVSGCQGNAYICHYLTTYGYPQIALAAIQGNSVGYSKVTVQEINNGYEEYYYTTPLDYPVFMNFEYPFVPLDIKSWQYGLLKEKLIYKTNGNNSEIVTKQLNSYNFNEQVNMDIAKIIKQVPIGNGQVISYEFVDNRYTLTSGLSNIASSVVMQYSQAHPTDYIETTQSFAYDNPLLTQPTSTSTETSKGELVESKMKYVLDYNFIANLPLTQSWAKGIKLLQDKHIIVPVIEQLQTKKIGNSTYVIGGTLTEYHADKPLQKAIWVLELDNPLLENSFTKSFINGNNEFIYDSRYTKRIDFEHYDTQGNLLQQRKTDDTPQAFIWGYNSTMPIAQVVNATYKEIYHTSFEDLATISNEAKTGTQSWVLTGNKYVLGTQNLVLEANKKYVFSYWHKPQNGGNWTQKRKEIVAGQAIETNETTGFIDEVRLYPADALMNTVTYTPLVGKTSETDANGVTSYYVYDDFNRLRYIKDQDGNIIQRFTYKYTD
jgi:hypothetical protein